MKVDEGHQRIDGCPVPCRSRYLQVLTMFQEMCDFPLGDLEKVVIWVGQMVFRFNMRESEWGGGASCELPEFLFSILIFGPKLSQIKCIISVIFCLCWHGSLQLGQPCNNKGCGNPMFFSCDRTVSEAGLVSRSPIFYQDSSDHQYDYMFSTVTGRWVIPFQKFSRLFDGGIQHRNITSLKLDEQKTVKQNTPTIAEVSFRNPIPPRLRHYH